MPNWRHNHLCTLCGFNIIRKQLFWQCEHCETVYASILDYNPQQIDRETMADLRDMYSLLAELGTIANSPELFAPLYHEAKEQAEQYDTLANGHAGSGPWAVLLSEIRQVPE
jgi:hypothetical protein